MKLSLEQLESKETPLNLVLNFDFDVLGLFRNMQGRMQSLANQFADQLIYDLQPINQSFTALTDFGQSKINNVKEDEMIIFIGIDNNPNHLASAAPGGYVAQSELNRSWGGFVGFNPNINWSFNANPSPAQFDINSVFTHELGHVLGLQHSSNPNSLMSESVNPGQIKKITVDDKIELSKLGIELKNPISPNWSAVTNPFPGFVGKFETQVADFNNDKVSEIIFGAGQGGGPHVRILDGATGREVASFFAFEPQFTGGLNITVGDYNQNGTPDLIVGAKTGGGPRLQIYEGGTQKIFDQFVFDPNQMTGVSVNWFNNNLVANNGTQFKVIY